MKQYYYRVFKLFLKFAKQSGVNSTEESVMFQLARDMIFELDLKYLNSDSNIVELCRVISKKIKLEEADTNFLIFDDKNSSNDESNLGANTIRNILSYSVSPHNPTKNN